MKLAIKVWVMVMVLSSSMFLQLLIFLPLLMSCSTFSFSNTTSTSSYQKHRLRSLQEKRLIQAWQDRSSTFGNKASVTLSREEDGYKGTDRRPYMIDMHMIYTMLTYYINKNIFLFSLFLNLLIDLINLFSLFFQ